MRKRRNMIDTTLMEVGNDKKYRLTWFHANCCFERRKEDWEKLKRKRRLIGRNGYWRF